MIALFEVLVLATAALSLAWIAEKVRLPSVLGMVLAGVVVSALPLSLPAEGLRLAHVSPSIREAVLALVLVRAGLGLSLSSVRKHGALVSRLAFVPLAGEVLLATVASHWLLGLDWPVAAVVGCLLGPISPAIVIPGLMSLMREATGSAKQLPSVLLAAAPLDNILGVLALGVAVELALGGPVPWGELALQLPYSVVGGVLLGGLSGLGMHWVLARRKPEDHGPLTAIAVWAVATGLVAVGQGTGTSFVLALVSFGATLRVQDPDQAAALVPQLARGWSVARYALFALIGTAVDLEPLAAAGLASVAVVVSGQAGRMAATWLATSGADLLPRQRLGVMAAWMPKATIQAAFAGLALDRGLAEGPLILSLGVLAIVIWAPFGVISLHRAAPSLLGVRTRAGQAPPSARVEGGLGFGLTSGAFGTRQG